MTTLFTQTWNGNTDVLNPSGDVFAAGELFSGGTYAYTHSDANAPIAATIDVSGSDWLVRGLFWNAGAGATYDFTIDDVSGGSDRKIDQIFLSSAGNVSLSFQVLKTRYIDGDGESFDVSLGSANTIAVKLSSTSNTFSTGAGSVGNLALDGTNDVTITSTVDALSMSGGTEHEVQVNSGGFVRSLQFEDAPLDLVIANDGRVKFLNGREQTADIRLTTGAQLDRATLTSNTVNLDAFGDTLVKSLELSGANAEIDLKGTSRINTLVADSGAIDLQLARQARVTNAVVDDSTGLASLSNTSRLSTLSAENSKLDIIVEGNARLGRAEVSKGSYTISTNSGYIEAITAKNAKLTADLGGGAAMISITADGVKRSHTIEADGYVELLTISETTAGHDTQSATVVLKGGAGAVRLGDGRDVVTLGQSYVDTLSTGGGNDKVTHGGDSLGTLLLGKGTDVVEIRAMERNDSVNAFGGQGNDTVNFSKINRAISVSLAETGPQELAKAGIGHVHLRGFETLIGTVKGDKLVGDAGANTLDGRNGADRLIGANGKDKLTGGNGADTLSGGNGNDTLSGSAGDDRLIGANGKDTLTGGKGNDTLSGGAAADLLNGGVGADRLTGGAGADVFEFSGTTGTDRITDFQEGSDLLKLKNENSFSDLSINSKNGDLRIEHSKGVIVLEGMASETLQANDFLFG